MKAAIFEPDKGIKVAERAKPEVGEGEVRVRVGRCGVCMTDVHITKGGFSVSEPVVLGHEFSGVVDELGPGVDWLDTGDRVAANPIISCGRCSYCRDGRTNFCKNAIVLGGAGDNIIDGGFQEYSVVPHKNLGKFDKSTSFEEAAFAEPLACAIRGVKRLKVNVSDEVLLIGAGPMGLLLLQLLTRQGISKIFVSEPMEERRQLASEFGADFLLNPEESNVPEAVKELSENGDGVDIAAEAVGSKATTKTAMRALRRGGKALVFGVPPEEAEVSVNIFDTYYDEVDLIGSYALTEQDFSDSISLIRNEQLELNRLVSHKFNLDDLKEAIEMTATGGGLKKQIKFDQI